MLKLHFLFLFLFPFGLYSQINVDKEKEIATHTLITKLSGHKSEITVLTISLTGKYLLSGDALGVIKIWDIVRKQEIHEFKVHSRAISSLKFSADEKKILSTSLDGFIRIFDFDTKKEINHFNTKQMVMQADFSMLPNEIIGHHGGYKYFKWDLKSSQIVYSDRLFGKIKYFEICKTKPQMLMATPEGAIRFWNYLEGYEIMTHYEVHKTLVSDLVLDSKEEWAISTNNNNLFLWHLPNPSKTKHCKLQYSSITGAFLNPVSYSAVLTLNYSQILYFDLTDLKITSSLSLPEECKVVVGSKNGNLLLAGGKTGNIFIYTTNGGVIKEIVEQFIQSFLGKWYEKGVFEKTNDYLSRIKEETIQTKTDSLIKLYMVENFSTFSPNWKKSKQSYDADNESFEVTFDNFRKISFKVPLQEAKNFNFATCTYQNPVYSIDEKDQICIVSIDIIDENKKIHTYRNNDMSFLKSYQLYKKVVPNSTPEKIIKPENITKNVVEKQNESNNNTQTDNNRVLLEKKIEQNAVKPSDVDINLPKTVTNNEHSVAVVIGNTNYQKTKKVNFGVHDAKIMKKYLIETMGFQEENILYIEDANYGDFKLVFGEKNNPKGKLYGMIKPAKSDLFVFYSGHGAPSLKDKKGYFIPVDCDPQYIELLGFPVDIFYENIGKVRAKSVTIAIDACFSGIDIYENISPIVIKAKGVTDIQSGALLASCGLEEVSCWYNEKSHGMFTYFFLKAIQTKAADLNKDNKLTLREIYQFASDEAEGVPYYARRYRGVEQKPTLQGQNLDRVLVEY